MNDSDKTYRTGGSYDSGVNSLLRSLRLAFIFLVILIAGLLVYFFTIRGFFRVDSREAVVVLRFGRYVDTYSRGWYWFMPYPVTKTIRIPASMQSLECSFTLSGMTPQENPDLAPGRDSYILTGDANILHSSWSLTYQITDPEKYYKTLYSEGDYQSMDEQAGISLSWRGPDEFLRQRFTRAVVEVTGQSKVDDVLFTGKGEYLAKVQKSFSEDILNAGCGIEIKAVNLNFIAPPNQTKAAFNDYSAAVSKATAMAIEAQEYKVKTENEAKSECATIAAAAEIYRTRTVSELKSRSIYFKSINEEYQKSPAVLTALYYNALSRAFSGLEDNFMLGPGASSARKQLRLKLNPEPKNSARAVNNDEGAAK